MAGLAIRNISGCMTVPEFVIDWEYKQTDREVSGVTEMDLREIY